MNVEGKFYFYILENLEKIDFSYNSIINKKIFFELNGIKRKDMSQIGTLFLTLFNNIDKIIDILEKSKQFLNEPFYKLEDFIEKELTIISEDVSQIIVNELDSYHSSKCENITQAFLYLEHTRKSLEEYRSLLNDNELYNQYYDKLIEEEKERIKELNSKEEINSKESYLNDLYKEKDNPEIGRRTILSIIDDMKVEEEEYLNEEKKRNELPKLIEEYISKLIATLLNYRYFFDLYFGIIKVDEFKNKELSYFQAIFGMDFEIPKHFIYSTYESNDTIFPLDNLKYSIYIDLKKDEYYRKLLDSITSLENNNHIFYLKLYEINTLKDILNIYFNYYLENNIHIKKCENCGKYFIPTSRSDEKYCDNVSPQNPQKTCKEYGAKKTYRDKINSDKIQKAHFTTSQFFRMKIKRCKNEKEKEKLTKLFEKYQTNYGKQKNKFDNKKITENYFVEWIVKQKDIT